MRSNALSVCLFEVLVDLFLQLRRGPEHITASLPLQRTRCNSGRRNPQKLAFHGVPTSDSQRDCWKLTHGFVKINELNNCRKHRRTEFILEII